MRKSETGTILPKIRTQRNSFTHKPRMKSVFIQRVKQEISHETSYEEMNTSNLSQQQRKLKQLLREFNDKSQMILQDFISAPAKLAEKTVPVQVPTDHLIKITEQQGSNLNKMLQQCQTQLKLLEGRCQNLKYTTKEEMVRQIQLTKVQIQRLRVQNKDTGRQVTLNGLNICRGDRYDLVKELQSQRLQLQVKKQQIAAQNQDVLKEIQSITKKTAEAQKEAMKVQADYKEAINIQHSLMALDKMKDQAKQKKKGIQLLKTKNEQVSGAIKQKYLTKLKELEQINGAGKKNADQLNIKEEGISKSRNQVIILEHQLSALRQGVTTIKLLDSKKKSN